MRKSALISGLLSLSLIAAGAAQAAGDVLRQGFEALTPAARAATQSELEIAGFYTGPIDGSYGPATARALEDAATFLPQNSKGQVRIDIASPQGVSTFLGGLSTLEYSKWLYGEGDESDF